MFPHSAEASPLQRGHSKQRVVTAFAACNSALHSVQPLCAAPREYYSRLRACSAEDCVIPARGKHMVSTDLSVAIPPCCYGRVAPRSGLAWKHSIDTGAGVIDSDYRGPLKVILFNFSDVDFQVCTACQRPAAWLAAPSTIRALDVSCPSSSEPASVSLGSAAAFHGGVLAGHTCCICP